MAAFLSHLDINTIVIVIVAVILGVQQWRSGTSKIGQETIQAYKDQLEITEKRYQSQQETLNLQAGQIGELKGLIAGKDARIEDYRKILENRDPALQKTLDELMKFMRDVDFRLTDISKHVQKPVVAETHTTITKQ